MSQYRYYQLSCHICTAISGLIHCVEEHNATINFPTETLVRQSRVFKLFATKIATATNYFLIWYSCKNLLYSIITHSYAVSLSIKSYFYENNVFFISRTNQNYTNSSTVFKSEFKINVQTNFLKFFLCQQLLVNKVFCMKSFSVKLFNIFKTANTMLLIKLILESPY